MSKSVHPTHDQQADALQSHQPRADGADQPSDMPARRDAPDGRNLLDRILNTSHLEQVVPRLEPAGFLKDKSLADLDNLPSPDELAKEFIENLETGLESFQAILNMVTTSR